MPLGQHLYTVLEEYLNEQDHNYNSLEIGVYNGDGTAFIGKSFPKKTVYAIDPFVEDGNTDWMTRVGKDNPLLDQKNQFENHNRDLTNVVLFEETSENFSNRLTEKMIEEMNVGGVIIDGDHSYEAVTVDYELAMRIINKKKNGIIIFDDINVPGVEKGLNVFLKKYSHSITTHQYRNDVNMLIAKIN